jgi:hypothetical protein
MLSGSCGCGAVQFEIAQVPEVLTNCYCKTCQKLHGAPFVTFARVLVSAVKWIKHDTLQHQRFSTIASRARCGSCGSQVYMEYFLRPHIVNFSAGLFDGAVGLPNISKLIYLKDKSAWDTGVAYKGIPCYDTMPEDFLQQLEAWEALGKEGVEIKWQN